MCSSANVDSAPMTTTTNLNRCVPLLRDILDKDISSRASSATTKHVVPVRTKKMRRYSAVKARTKVKKSAIANEVRQKCGKPAEKNSKDTKAGATSASKPVCRTPYNRRLPSSTPQLTPKKTDPLISSVDSSVAASALNSSRQLGAVSTKFPEEAGPRLLGGDVDFVARPIQDDMLAGCVPQLLPDTHQPIAGVSVGIPPPKLAYVGAASTGYVAHYDHYYTACQQRAAAPAFSIESLSCSPPERDVPSHPALTQVKSVDVPKADHKSTARASCQTKRPVTKNHAVQVKKKDASATGKKNVGTQFNEAATQTTTSDVDVTSSMGDAESHLRELSRTLIEVKAITGSLQDEKLNRLIARIDENLALLLPPGGHSLPIEMELVVLPLRSENAQLRRRLRIVAQQMKEKTQQAENLQKTDPSFQVIHLEMMCQKLESDLREQKEMCIRLTTELHDTQQEMISFSDNKTELLRVLASKDSDHVRSQQQWLSEMQKVKANLESAHQEQSSAQKRIEQTAADAQLLRVTSEQKDKEIARLQELVMSLQTSMGQLVLDMQRSRPPAGQAVNTAAIVVADDTDRTITETNENTSTPRSKGHMQCIVQRSPLGANTDSASSPIKRSLQFVEEQTLPKPPVMAAFPADTSDFTDFLQPPRVEVERDVGAGGDNMTVKDVLTSLAGRMRSQHAKTHSTTDIESESRYSVTDYFNNYPSNPVGSQKATFSGTSLDTSMSTIAELATGQDDLSSCLSSTMASVMSLDDKEFRDGLAHLDANIADIQRTLHCAMKKSLQ